MRLATWNVNSLKARLERVEAWIDEVQPDVLCLQETKMHDEAFPVRAFAGRGYTAAHHGEGRWNGVAILSRLGIDDVRFGFAGGDGDDEARLISGTCGGARIVCAYAPNGRQVGHEQYAAKLEWFDRLVSEVRDAAGPAILCGDLNVAPETIDVWDEREVHGGTHVSDRERARFGALLDAGMIDVFRLHHEGQHRLYSWWDYRAGNFHKHKGMRIDHVLATPDLARQSRWALIDRNARKGKSPSDHAPVVVDFDSVVP